MNTLSLNRRRLRTLLAVGIVAGLGLPVLAAPARNKWYVDKGHANAADTLDEGRGTEGKPFRTIQAAIDYAVAEDTIYVKPGVYDEGGRPAMDGGCTNRITLTKAVDILSTDGAEVTHIVGSPDPSTGGYGPAAVRCAWLDSSRWKSLAGFTIRDGWTPGVNGDWTHSCGGGVYVKDSNNQMPYIFIRECIIENCHGYFGGGGVSGTYIRCLVRNCSATGGSAALYGCRAHTCVLSGNGEGGSDKSVIKDSRIACSTVVGNANGIRSVTCYNVLAVGNGGFDFANCTCNSSSDSEAAGRGAVIAPGLADWHLVSGTTAINGGRGEYVLAETSTASDFKAIYDVNKTWVDVDFYGNSRAQTGAIDIGAVEGGHVASANGRIYVAGGNLSFDGKTAYPGEWVASTIPTQYLVRAILPPGKELAYVSFQQDAYRRVHADMNGNIGLIPPVLGEYTATVVPASRVLYVNPDKSVGVDDLSHGTSALTPFRTLQYAVDAVTDNQPTVIHAAGGDYCEGGKDGSTIYGGSGWIMNRVLIANRNILLKGAGAGLSFITGAPDSTTGGNGGGAVRAVLGYSNYATVQGFTIRNSYSYGTSMNGKLMEGYALCGCWSPSNTGFQIVDCAVEDCAGGDRCFMSYMSAFRCAFKNNTALNVNGCTISTCLFENNGTGGSGSSIIGYWTTAYNCTALGRDGKLLTPDTTGSKTVCTWVYQSVLDTASRLYSETTDFAGCLADNLASTAGNPATGVTMGDPCYANVLQGDYRLMYVSPGFACGCAPTADNYAANWHLYVSTGLDGKILSFSADGRPVAGANFGKVTLEKAAYVQAENGGLAIENGTVGLNELTGAKTITITAADATRPCFGYAVNGVTNHFDEVVSRTFTAADAVDGLDIRALYAPHWYVNADPEVGDDNNRGYTPKTAKRTLRAAMEAVNLVAHDTVHAARGDYNDLSMADQNRSEITVRVVVPDNVTLVADEGRDVTFITGAKATGPDADQYGRGVGAVACASLGTGSRLRGFTLRGGRTKVSTDGDWWDHEGAGVTSMNRTDSECQDCIITDCASYESVCIYTTLRRCLVVGNRGEKQGSGGAWTRFYDCVVDGNVGDFAVINPYALVSTTIGANNSGRVPLYFVQTPVVMTNCLVLCDTSVNKTYERLAPGTYIGGTLTSDSPLEGVTVTDPANLAIDSVHRPIKGRNIAIDVLDASQALSATDATGGQRVYNGLLDAGAVECDYRPIFTADLGSRLAVVTSASPETVEDTTAGVDIKRGRVAITWRNPGGQEVKHHFAVNVTGTGVLTVRYDGKEETYTAASGPQTLAFVSAAASNDLSFEYVPGAADTGWAQLAEFKRDRGFALTIR